MTSAPANLPSAHQIIEQNQSMELLKTTYRTELDVLMDQAKMYPRDMIKRIDEAKTIACSSPEIAEACFYKKPGGQDTIEGPSVRLAEIIAMCWGNMMVDVRTQMITDTEVICRGMGMDCQSGFGVSLETRIRIVDRNGQRYPDHLVTTTALAGCSIAYRNIVFRLVPAALVQPVYLAVKDAAIGTGDKFEKRRVEVIERLQTNLGISTARILLAVAAEEMEQITPNQLETLIGFGTAIHNGDVSMEEVFPPPGANVSAQLSEKLKRDAPTGGDQNPGEAQSASGATGGQGTAPPASSAPPNLSPDAQRLIDMAGMPAGGGGGPVVDTKKPELIEMDPAQNDPVKLADPQPSPAPTELEATLTQAMDPPAPPEAPADKKPILDQLIDWFKDRAGVNSHESFKRLQSYAQSTIDKDINIQHMSDRALNSLWLTLKKQRPEHVL